MAIVDTQKAMSDLKKEQIDASVSHFHREMEEYEYQIARLDQTMRANAVGSQMWNEAHEKKLDIMRRQWLITRYESEDLTEMLRNAQDLSPDEVQNYQRRLRELTLQYRELGLSMIEARKQAEEALQSDDAINPNIEKVIDAYKKAIQEKQTAHLKSIDKEMEAENKRHQKVLENYRKELDEFREIIRLKIQEIDREDARRDYDQGMDELNEQRLEIERQLSLLSMDDSREAKYKRKKLQEELKQLDKDAENRQYKWEKEQRKEALNDMMSDKEKEIQERERLENEYHENEVKRIEELREYWNQFYIDLLNDERKFAKMREEMINGNFEYIEQEFEDLIDYLEATMPDLENTLNGTMEAVGTAIRQNIIDELKNALSLIGEMREELAKAGEESEAPGIDLDQGLHNPQDDVQNVKSEYSESDFQVMIGKLIRHNLADLVGKNEQEKKLIAIKGSDYAAVGREGGSTIDDQISYDDLIMQLQHEDVRGLSDALKEYAKTLPDEEYELKDWIEREAERLRIAASFDTGGLI